MNLITVFATTVRVTSAGHAQITKYLNNDGQMGAQDLSQVIRDWRDCPEPPALVPR